MKFKEDLRELNDVQEISINFKPKKRKTQIKIGSSSCAEDVFRIFFEDEISYRENFMIMILTNSNHVLGIKKISVGGMTACVVDVRNIIQAVLMAHGVSLILCHNHPSGTLKPSQADKNITSKIGKACKVLDIKLLDHIILTEESYFSFADNGEKLD